MAEIDPMSAILEMGLKLSIDSQFHRVIASNVFPHFLDARLLEIDVPTTILWGEYDGVVLRSYVDRLESGIAGSKVKVIRGAAHIPHAQQPELFVEALLEGF